jgi:hypothetical protein
VTTNLYGLITRHFDKNRSRRINISDSRNWQISTSLARTSYAVLLKFTSGSCQNAPPTLVARFTIDRTVLDVYVIPPIAATPAVL